ncbi:hypothetical protein PAMP_019433 [Pampus punctatissimus]
MAHLIPNATDSCSSNDETQLAQETNKVPSVFLLMDDQWNYIIGQNAHLVILTFLQADSRVSNYDDELCSLGKDLNLSCNSWVETEDDGGLETDGYLPGRASASLDDIQPSVQLHQPENQAEAAAIQEVAAELREIAAQFEDHIMVHATQNLRKNIISSPYQDWKKHLSQEVDKVMRHGVGLEHLPQERIMVALTLTLVKRVCQETPVLLRCLFSVALQYICPVRAR